MTTRPRLTYPFRHGLAAIVRLALHWYGQGCQVLAEWTGGL